MYLVSSLERCNKIYFLILFHSFSTYFWIDAVKLPFAGDVFTATELGKSLMSQYQDVRIVHLYRGKDWYDPVKLQEADVLVAFLDAFDLAKALKSHSSSVKNGPKPTLITIAWARNWFHRWLVQPWMGNYDMILTSSILSQRFYEEYGKRYGLPVKCIQGCPPESAPSLSCFGAIDVPYDPYDTTPVVKKQGRRLDSLVEVANQPTVVNMTCTMSLKTKKSNGDCVTKVVRFEYLYSQIDGNGTLGDAPSAVDSAQPKPKSRSRFEYRVEVPVRVLRIASNTDNFIKKGKYSSVVAVTAFRFSIYFDLPFEFMTERKDELELSFTALFSKEEEEEFN